MNGILCMKRALYMFDIIIIIIIIIMFYLAESSADPIWPASYTGEG